MSTVPQSMMIQLSRLFGESSKEAKSNNRTDRQWKKTLQKSLDELLRYTEENIHTDELHWLMICSGFASAHESLNEEEFWPGFVEGIMRVCFLLMGDYPDHRKYKGGKKKAGHYSLDRYREVIYYQNQEKKKNTLYAAGMAGFPQLEVNPRDAISKFREECGYKVGAREFMRWFKKNYPSDYAALF
jgi:hypothetical protein